MAFRLAHLAVGDQIDHIAGRQDLARGDHTGGLMPFRIDVCNHDSFVFPQRFLDLRRENDASKKTGSSGALWQSSCQV
jgi:hypothetical protein